MNPHENMTREELQQALLHFGRNFHVFLGCTYSKSREVIKQHGLLNPTEYVRQLNEHGILQLLRAHGSWKRAAEWLSVSESFLKAYVGNELILEEPKILEIENFEDEITRIGSVSLYARLKGVKESAIRKYAKEKGIELSKLIRYENTGFENAKGRKAELYFAEQRSSNIEKDMNLECSQAPYDFEDSVYGRVDVKSSKRHLYRSKKRSSYREYWKFAVDGLECDTVAFVAMDEVYEKPIGFYVVDRSWIPEKLTAVVINELMFKNFASGPLTKEQFEKFVLKSNFSELLSPVQRLKRVKV